jgi:UDP:flavonoid glycosyltransferase YjiC (YdhE family)
VRILFTFSGGFGHAEPMVPVAQAARAAGHTTAFLGRASVLARLAERGFDVVSDGLPSDEPRTEITPLMAPDAEYEAQVLRNAFAGEYARRRAARMTEVCAAWAPDVVVAEESDFGSQVAAEAVGLPYATALCGAAGSFMRPEVVAEPVDALREAHGLAPDPALEAPARHLVISPFPPSFRDPAFPLPPTALSIRPAAPGPEPADATLAWLAARPRRPVVYFTLGTVFNMESGDLFARVLAALAGLDVNAIATVGREIDPGSLGRQPEHVRVERFVPQAALLAHCDATISHGGSGSTIGALAAGVPMVLLPMGADQPDNARRVVALGAGVALDVMRCTSADVGAAVEAVLGDAAHRAAAARIRDEIAALPGPEAAVAALERLVRTTEPTLGRKADDAARPAP